MEDWIARLFDNKDLLRMGHCQRAEDLNLGMGWVYYALVRLIRPKNVVVIGSWRGFSPLVFGKALADNMENGKVTFIDPSMVDDFWKNPDKVRSYFADFGITHIEHFLLTTQQFIKTDAYRALIDVDIVMIDGYHTHEQARVDYEAFIPRLSPNGVILLHDSANTAVSRIYGKDVPYQRSVKDFVDVLKHDPNLQVFDLPFSEGLTLVRKVA